MLDLETFLLRHPLWPLANLAVLCAFAFLYARGWRRLRNVDPGLANRLRLVVFVIASTAFAAALVAPVHALSGQLLSMRALQKLLLCMMAAPLLWLACPAHVMTWGLPSRWRRAVTRSVLRRSAQGRLIRRLTHPLIAWLAFVSVFLLWHDPAVVDRTFDNGWLHVATAWALFLAALLFWWHVVGTGPRIHAALPLWMGIVYLLAVEIPNMAAGVTVAFTSTPLYSHYVTAHAALAGIPRLPLGIMEDQMMAGALVWVTGSLVYISSIITIVYRVLAQHDIHQPEPFANWDAHERMIAPGLEHRVARDG